MSERFTQSQVDAINARNAVVAPKKPVALAEASPMSAAMHPCTDEDKLNKTERAYLARLRLLRPEFIGIQNITFKLGDDCRFTPDFSYIDANGVLVFVDVKGFQRDDALVKIKTAARQFRLFRFVIAKKVGHEWEETPIKP